MVYENRFLCLPTKLFPDSAHCSALEAVLPDYRWDVHKAQLSHVSLDEGANISAGEIKNDRSPLFVQVFMLAFSVLT